MIRALLIALAMSAAQAQPAGLPMREGLPTLAPILEKVTPAVAVDVEFPGGAIVQYDTSTVTLAFASGPAGAVRAPPPSTTAAASRK